MFTGAGSRTGRKRGEIFHPNATPLTAAQKAKAQQTIGVREVLSATRTYYVRTDGSDSNTGLANTAGGAFLTIGAAITAVKGIDLNGYAVTIQVADGTYTASLAFNAAWVGSGTVTLQGNTGTPANVVISTTSADAITVSAGCVLTITGVKVQTTTSGHGIFVSGGARVTIGAVNFGAVANNHVIIGSAAYVSFSSAYTISGGAQAHINMLLAGLAEFYSLTVTVSGTPAFSAAFMFMASGSQVNTASMTYSGSATGSRYSVSTNAVLNTNGGGSSYFPGNSAGSTATGGQYA